MQIQIQGVEQLKARMRTLQQGLAGPSIRKAVRAGGQVIATAIEAAAPVLDEKTANSTALDPGALKADIKVRMRTEDQEPVALIGPGPKTARVARWVEYGHRLIRGGQLKILANGKTKGRGQLVGDVPAHPFIRPAFESSVTAAQETVVETMKSEIALLEK